MRRLLFTAIITTTLTLALTANEHYLLPEHQSDLMHTLKRKIERAGTITLITRKLDSPSLTKSIEKSLLNKASFHLITTDMATAAYYAKYKNSSVKIPRSNRLTEIFHLNILLIDESDVCFSTLPLSEGIWKREIGEVICTTEREEIDFALDIKRRFTERFEDYNQ